MLPPSLHRHPKEAPLPSPSQSRCQLEQRNTQLRAKESRPAMPAAPGVPAPLALTSASAAFRSPLAPSDSSFLLLLLPQHLLSSQRFAGWPSAASRNRAETGPGTRRLLPVPAAAAAPAASGEALGPHLQSIRSDDTGKGMLAQRSCCSPRGSALHGAVTSLSPATGSSETTRLRARQ